MSGEHLQDDMKKRCGRTIEKNKYENNSPEARTWWNHMFSILESDASIPPDKRKEVLQAICPSKIVNRIISILGIEERKFKEPTEAPSDEIADELRKMEFGKPSSLFLFSQDSIAEEEELHGPEKVAPSSASESIAQFGAVPKPKPNPYLNFFKRRPGREAIWRDLPPLSLDELTLGQKSDVITENIARNFVSWIKTLGGDEESYLTVQGVVEMFEIGYPVNATTSLRVELKEMPSTTKKVANAIMRPELARRTRLHEEIKGDKKASKRIPHIVAFGRGLPADMQIKPPNRKAMENWLHCEIPERLESMAEVWQGITHLKSTKAFCEYLYYQRPDLVPPPYLTSVGMMDIDPAEVGKASSEKDDAFGNILHLTNV